LGGSISTRRAQGFTIEGGADSFITNKPHAVDLCRALGLGDQLIGTDPQHRRSFVVRNGRLAPVPEGFVLMAPNRLGPILTTPILSWRGELPMLLLLGFPRPDKDDRRDERPAAVLKRRPGPGAPAPRVQP